MITFSIRGGKGLVRLIRNVNEFLEDFEDREEVMEDVKRQQNERWARNFEGQGSEYKPWKPTSASQQENRRRRGQSTTPTLKITGRTQAHFIDQNEDADAGNTAITWNFENLIAGNNGAYTVSHHMGYNLGGNRVPRRFLWDLDAEDEDRGAQEFDEWLDGLAKTHFG